MVVAHCRFESPFVRSSRLICCDMYTVSTGTHSATTYPVYKEGCRVSVHLDHVAWVEHIDMPIHPGEGEGAPDLYVDGPLSLVGEDCYWSDCRKVVRVFLVGWTILTDPLYLEEWPWGR